MKQQTEAPEVREWEWEQGWNAKRKIAHPAAGKRWSGRTTYFILLMSFTSIVKELYLNNLEKNSEGLVVLKITQLNIVYSF